MRALLLTLALLLYAAPSAAQHYQLPHNGNVPAPLPKGYPYCLIIIPKPAEHGAMKIFGNPQERHPPHEDGLLAALNEAKRRGLIYIQRCQHEPA